MPGFDHQIGIVMPGRREAGEPGMTAISRYLPRAA
jgi:hypothetical protein